MDRLLSTAPRDVALLERMVTLCDDAGDVELAAEYQQRLAGLADTPENRFRLVQLQLDADLIDIKTALSRRVSLASNPVRLGSMIRSSVARNDNQTAMAICEEALARDPSLWDVKLQLAQLLLLEQPDEAPPACELAKIHQRALELAAEVRDADYPLDARPPTVRKPNSKSTRSRPTSVSPSSWASSGYQLARVYR